MDEALKDQIIGNIEDTYIAEPQNKYTGLMVLKMIDLVHHLMDRYGKIVETNLKENRKRLNETLDTNIPNVKYFEIIYECIQYLYSVKKPYTLSHIIKNSYNMVLDMSCI